MMTRRSHESITSKILSKIQIARIVAYIPTKAECVMSQTNSKGEENEA